MESRRIFLKQSMLATAALVTPALAANPRFWAPEGPSTEERTPWYRRALRWGQTNINEMDPARYDILWWRDYWKRTRTQGVMINAGGIVAYYPSKYPLHRRAQFLGERDLFGELAAAAHAEGLAVLARMDSGGAGDDFFRAHPGWFAVDANGESYRARGLYVPCINGPYCREYI